jgi:hypothetical protein
MGGNGKKSDMQQKAGIVLLSEEELVIETCSVCPWFGVYGQARPRRFSGLGLSERNWLKLAEVP